MVIQKLPHTLTVCRVGRMADIDMSAEPLFIAVTDEEISVVCPTENAPESAYAREDGWRAFRIAGELDFSLIGILSGISSILAENGIGIFAVSTYNTDYILTKSENFSRAASVLEAAGYEIMQRK